MSMFDQLKSDWQDQSGHMSSELKDPASIRDRVRRMKAKNRIAIGVLSLTLVIVGLFFFQVGAIGAPGYGLPVMLMLGALFFRILAEIWGHIDLGGISPTQSAEAYQRSLLRYYNQRQWVHFVLTPLAFIAYVWGFILLLPTFKASLSGGMYTYILISGPVILLAILALVFVQIRRELRILKSLRPEA